MLLQKLLQNLFKEANANDEEPKTAYKILQVTGKINRQRRRKTARDARGVDHNSAKKPEIDAKKKRQAKRKQAKKARRITRG